jgi:hypothetical protein
MKLYSKLALIDGHHQLPLRQWSMDKYAVQLQLSTTCNNVHVFSLSERFVIWNIGVVYGSSIYNDIFQIAFLRFSIFRSGILIGI